MKKAITRCARCGAEIGFGSRVRVVLSYEGSKSVLDKASASAMVCG